MSPNGTAHKGGVCTHRNNGEGHCFHLSQPPYNVLNTPTVVFASACCFCAPSWLHYDIYLSHQVSDEDLVAQQMLHGPRVTVERMPKRGIQIVLAR